VLRSHRWRTAENSAGYLLPLLRPTDQLLDIGTGPGTITVDFAARLAAGWVTGLDNAPTAVAETRRLATERGLRNLTVTEGDVYALSFDDGAFDVVHAHQVLQHLADPVAALREMARVCAPDGVVAVRDADYAAMTWFPDRPELHRWLRLYRAGGPAQRRRAGRRSPTRRLGAGRRVRCGLRHRLGLVLRRSRRPGLVVGHLGGPAAHLELRRAGRAPRPH
jgi:SAM-dependent methyltransferase